MVFVNCTQRQLTKIKVNVKQTFEMSSSYQYLLLISQQCHIQLYSQLKWKSIKYEVYLIAVGKIYQSWNGK